MDQAVADRIGDAGLANGGVPRGRRELAGNERRRPFAPIFDDLEQVPALGIGERREQPIINREEIELGEFRQEPAHTMPSPRLTASSCSSRGART